MSSHDHSAHLRKYEAILRRMRRKLWIPPRWTIRFEIGCPEQMPNAQGYCTWRYLPNAQYRIVLSCNLSDELAEWVIAHELLEALTSPYAGLYEQALDLLEAEQIPSKLLNVLREQHGDVRNELIEWILRIVLKRERPEQWEQLREYSLA